MHFRTLRIGIMLLLFPACSACFAVCPSASHLGNFASFALSPDGKRIAALAEDGVLSWWDVATGKRTQLMECLPNSISVDRPIVFSPDSSRVAVVVDGAIHIFELPSGNVVARLTGHEVKTVETIVFSADGRRLAASHTNGVTVWAVATQRQLLSMTERTGRFALALNHNGSLFAAGGRDGITLWNVDSGQPTRTIHLLPNQFAEDLLFVDDNRLVSALSRANGNIERHTVQFDREITIWDGTTGDKVRTLEGQTTEGPFPLASTEQHLLLAFGYDGTMRSWDLDSGQQISSLQTPPASVSRDGKFLLYQSGSIGGLELRRLGDSDEEVRTFAYRSPLCAAGATSDHLGQGAGFELLFFADGFAKDGTTMIGGRGFVTPDCTRLNVRHGEFPSEEAARGELQDELKRMTGAIVEEGPRQIFGFVYGERALVRFPATRFHSEHVELLLTDGKKFYSISSSSLELVLEVERRYYH